jgi:hypothetical protein
MADPLLSVVDGDVKMSDPRRDVARGRTAYGHDAQILHRYGMKATPVASGPGSGGSTNNLGAGSFSMGTTSDAALWAKALVASSTPAAVAASVLARMFTSFSPIGYAERGTNLT